MCSLNVAILSPSPPRSATHRQGKVLEMNDSLLETPSPLLTHCGSNGASRAQHITHHIKLSRISSAVHERPNRIRGWHWSRALDGVGTRTCLSSARRRRSCESASGYLCVLLPFDDKYEEAKAELMTPEEYASLRAEELKGYEGEEMLTGGMKERKRGPAFLPRMPDGAVVDSAVLAT